eukprot:CAMPEP_0184260624 /NCGR_PEP_ID=MMETSP0977-20130417/13438_1 /TAXON_ID=483370 /ORGANISM="non described non described, Strain CCMP2097" /LENGTH=276 /DNA_ID=CAMNT_0026566289 /DNA_START=48 /DNA_END=878 /DNA_ORIENTATION=+
MVGPAFSNGPADQADCAAHPSSSWGRKTRLRVTLVRHGESMNNVHEAISEEDYRAHRTADPDLSPRGYLQAAALGRFVADRDKSAHLGIHPLNELWVSPVRRTLLTMAPAAEALGMAPRVHLRLFEAGGIYDADANYTEFSALGGLTRNEMAAAHPNYVLPAAVTDKGWYTARSGAKETDDECRDRAKEVATALKDKAALLEGDESILLVVHYDFICALLDAFLQPGTTGHFARWKHYNTALTVLDVDVGGEVSFISQNAIPHLYDDALLISGFKV